MREHPDHAIESDVEPPPEFGGEIGAGHWHHGHLPSIRTIAAMFVEQGGPDAFG